MKCDNPYGVRVYIHFLQLRNGSGGSTVLPYFCFLAMDITFYFSKKRALHGDNYLICHGW